MLKRIQRKRTKGWRMPKNTVSVTRPGKYGNPFEIGALGITVDNCLRLFEIYVFNRIREEPDFLKPLRGKNLACFCSLEQPCHADVLLRLANHGGTHGHEGKEEMHDTARRRF